MIQTSEQINEIAGAMAKAQAEIENIERSGANPAFKREGAPSRYATLGGALEEVRQKFASQGIAILQMPINGEGSNIGVATRFAHSSGQWIESTLFVAPTKFDAQGAGSAITYLRRYALMAMAGIAPEDDDGNAASIERPQAPQRAGMVRAADVPRNEARPLAAEPAANGKAATSTEPSHTRSATGNGNGTASVQQRAREYRDAMKALLAKCKIPADVETLITNNSKDLEGMKKVAPEIYAEIMAESTNVKNEMYAGA